MTSGGDRVSTLKRIPVLAALVCILFVGIIGAQDPATDVATEQVKPQVRQVQVLIERDVPMKMRDGTILRADVYRPKDDARYPVILTRTPYNKLRHTGGGRLNPIDLAYAGYARVVQDIRGRYASEGTYFIGEHVTPQGMNDAYDTVEWIAAQPWCDGNVGMIGGSYEGSVQWPAAMSNPPHLKAIVPIVGPCGFLYEQALFGGPSYHAFLIYWTLIMGPDIADRLEQQGEDVTEMRRMIADAFANREPVLNHLPLKENPYLKFEGMWDIFSAMVLGFNPDFESPLMKQALDGAMILYGLSSRDDAVFWPYHVVNVPALQIAGWYDISTWSTFKNFTGMREKGGTEFARASQHILMGPWQHGAQNAEHLGDLDFGGYSPSGPTMQADVIAFFDRYLKGKDTQVPAVKYFTMGENRWHTADEWPLLGTERQRFYLHSGGHAATAAGDGVLGRHAPGEEPTDSYVYDPLDPVPTTGGRHIQMGGVVPGPKNQIYVEQRPDVLCYTTPELTEAVEVTGWVKLHLYAATSARDTDFTAQLIDVHPNGRAYNMADGVVRARYRDSVFSPELVTPGEVDEYTISLGVTSHLFKNGHRIRVDVSSSNFPAWDRNMNTGNPIGEDTEPVKANQTIYHSAEHPSYIELPVIPR
jgi:putative CocE/NonD family hydrolase